MCIPNNVFKSQISFAHTLKTYLSYYRHNLSFPTILKNHAKNKNAVYTIGNHTPLRSRLLELSRNAPSGWVALLDNPKDGCGKETGNHECLAQHPFLLYATITWLYLHCCIIGGREEQFSCDSWCQGRYCSYVTHKSLDGLVRIHVIQVNVLIIRPCER